MTRKNKILHHLITFLTILIFFVFSFTVVAADNNNPVNSEKTAIRAGESAENVTVSFVTLRNKADKESLSELFDGQRGQLQTGTSTLSFSPIRGLEELADSVPFYIPDEKVEIQDIKLSSLEKLLQGTESLTLNKGGNIAVYIHGYNIGFEKGCRHSAVLQRSLGLQGKLLLLSWPADTNILTYTRDEADLVWSVPYMADFFENLISRSGYGRTDIVAHSLGARGAVQALIRLACQKRDRKLLDELVLIAPDIDTDVFSNDLPLLKRVVNRITIYVSENDKPLKLSKEVHGYPRLGEAGEELTVFEGVDTIDISKLGLQRFTGHLYHLSDKEVIEDMQLLLKGKVSAEMRPRLRKKAHKGGTYYQMLPYE